MTNDAVVRRHTSIRFPNPMTWSFVIGLPLCVVLLGGLVATFLYVEDKKQDVVTKVDLQTVATGFDGPKGYVQLNGMIAQKFIVKEYFKKYRGANGVSLYAPVVEQGWTPATPVRYLIHFRTTIPSDGSENVPAEFAMRMLSPSLITGKLNREIPASVMQKLVAKHITTAPGVVMLDWHDAPDQDRYPFYDDVFIAVAITVALSGITFVLLSLAKWQNARVLPKP